ncbi:LysR family transcriptional regulator [Microvirga tunisiensis]|uniref:LysR family transcriptional regulator n=1 Tax=Microvirga tunisiensis TaxID=2108360 RepID=A0A5N7MHM8_9HYPH|nr:LysR family transcriptional regulator [Microvirga tunisiensis]MPR08242.1 LysR family transcriptional regulator [Microvirga tunisiensis]MPR26417.1 LysR family transcriptional regulator [Microvirga tunisiensis]
MNRFAAMATFVRVAERGSLSAAARELGLTQPAVSQQIAGLERHLRTRLLNRSTRKLTLTASGETYLARSRQILDEVAEVEDDLLSLSSELKGSLRVQAPSGLGQRYLAPLIVEFHRQHPGLMVELILDDHLADLIEEGVDVALRLETLASSGLIARKLGSVSRILVASPGYVAAHGSPTTPDELARHDHVRFSWTAAGEHLTLIGPQGPVAVDVKSSFRANNSFVLMEALRAGLGVGGVQLPLVQDLLESGELVRVMEDYAYSPMDLHAVYSSGRFVPRKVRALLDHVVAGMVQVPGLEPSPRFTEGDREPNAHYVAFRQGSAHQLYLLRNPASPHSSSA